MNKFRVNLHPAFFDPEKSESIEQKDPLKDSLDAFGEQFQQQEFPNLVQDVAKKAFDRYTDISQRDSDHRRFRERIATKKEGVDRPYADVWAKKITEGRGKLLMALEEEHYFGDFKTDDAKNAEISKIKEKYKEEVERQYIDNVWHAGKNQFNAIKDKLFGESDPNYPANKIYCKVTGASSIFAAGRSFRTGYGIDDLVAKEPDDSETVETSADTDDKYLTRKERNFLSRDLPEYLWNIRGRTEGNLNLGLISIEEDRASKVDRKAIKQFLKAAGKITAPEGKDNAIALLEVFRDNRLNARSGKKKYKEILGAHDINVDDLSDGDMSAIVKAGTFYISTQRENLSARNQHAIYLSVLTIIEEAGGADNAINNNKDKVEKAKSEKKSGKESGYENGADLQVYNSELYGLAKKLGITDYASATRLAKKEKSYFDENTPIENILANLNNDDELNAGDYIVGGQKSGQQFLEMLNQLSDKDAALNNLYQRAVLENTSLGLNIESMSDVEAVKAAIRNGDTRVILLLQNIINKPGEDLYTLLSGRIEGEGLTAGISEEKLLEAETEGQAREAAFKEAGEILKREDLKLEAYKNLFEGKKGVDVSNFADLQAALASCLYDNYKLGLGVGSTLSFNNWAEGLEIGVGAQARDKGGMVGLNIGYKKDFYVGRGWTVTPGLQGGVFLPIAQGSKKALASAGLNFTADKRTVDLDTGMAHHYGFDAGFNIVTTTVYGGWHESWNKLEGLQEAASYQSRLFEQNVMWSLLDDIKTKLNGAKMDLTDPTVLGIVEGSVKAAIEKQEGVEEGDKEVMINGMIRMLTVYNNEDLNKPGVKYVIARNIAEQYKHSWIEQRKIDIQKEGAYYSGYSLGAFWKVGTHLVGVYATSSSTFHEMDGSGDVSWNQYEQQNISAERWNDDLLDNEINEKLGIKGTDNALRIDAETGLVVIPASMSHRVKVTDKMKGLMKRDDKGSISIDSRTPMDSIVPVGTVTKGGEIIVGGKKGDKCTNVALVGADWFTDGEFDEQRVSELREGIDEYTSDLLNNTLQQLKIKCPGDDKLNAFIDNFVATPELLQTLNEINEGNHKVKLTLAPNEQGNLELQEPQPGDEGKGLEIVYKSNSQMIDKDVIFIAGKVYGEALKVKNPTVLHEVKHKPSWPKWNEFETAYKKLIDEGMGENNANESVVKEKIKNIFKELDRRIPGADFTSISTEIDNRKLTGDALVQALMSIKNIFARSSQVRGGEAEGEYEFKTRNGGSNTMLNIIKQRSGEVPRIKGILETLKANNNISDEAKSRYESLFGAISKHVKKGGFDIHKTTAAQLNNTVGFNLGDNVNPENPLFNPEIYETMVDLNNLDGFDETARDGLHKRTMSLFAKNPALVNPILERLGVSGMNKDTLEELVKRAEEGEGNNKIEVNEGKCIITLDIGGKIYKIKSGMKFGFFTQCVNHTIILDDIEGEGDGNTVKFDSGLGSSHLNEGTGGKIMSSTTSSVGISITLGGEESQTEEKKEEEENKDVASDDALDGGRQFHTGENPDPKDPDEAQPDGEQTDSGNIR